MAIGRGITSNRMIDAGAGNRRAGSHLVWSVAIMVIVLRLTLLLIFHHWSISTGKEGLSPLYNEGDDGGTYYNWALDIANGSDVFVVNIYPCLLGWAMKITGVTDIFPYKLANCLSGCACVLLALVIFRLLMERHDHLRVSEAKPAALVILLVGLYPSGTAFTLISLYRDACIYLLHLTAVYLCLRVLFARSALTKLEIIGGIIPVLYLLHSFRWYACVSVLLGVLIWTAVDTAYRLRRRRLRVRSLASLMVMALVVIGLVVSQGITPGSDRIDSLDNYRAGYSATGARSNLGVELPSMRDPRFLPLYAYSLVSNVFGPFPLQAERDQARVVMLLEAPVLLFVGVQIWKRRRYLNRGSAFLLCQAAAWFLLIAYANDNLGTAARLRVVGWHCVFILCGCLVYAAMCARRAAHTAQTEVERSQ